MKACILKGAYNDNESIEIDQSFNVINVQLNKSKVA
jgi:hypothetical protein